MLIRCRGASAPSQPPPFRGRGTPSLSVQTASPANHNHEPAAHLSANHSPYRLAVPEKIFALFVCSIFSTATDSPPRFIRHRRRSAPNPQPPRPSPSASPNTPRVLPSRSNHQPIRAPFPHRERGWGERADAPAATLGAILCAVRIDFRLPPEINPYPAQPATGVLGQRPKRILPTFVRTKVGPRRVGVLTMISKRPAPPPGACKLFHEHPPQATTKQRRRWATANQPPKKKQPAHRRLLRFGLRFYSIPVSCLVMRSQPM